MGTERKKGDLFLCQRLVTGYLCLVLGAIIWFV